MHDSHRSQGSQTSLFYVHEVHDFHKVIQITNGLDQLHSYLKKLKYKSFPINEFFSCPHR